MPRSHAPHPPEFRRRMVELVRSGRTPEGGGLRPLDPDEGYAPGPRGLKR